MDQDSTLETPRQPESETPQVARKEFSVTLIVIAILVITVIFVVIVFLSFFHKPQKKQVISRQLITPTVAPQKESEVTNDTIIAKSLDVPALYPHAQWKDVTGATHDAMVNTLYTSTNATIHFKGRYWSASIQNDPSYSVSSYYYDQLEKNGWFKRGGSENLKFKDFSLLPQGEGGSCGGGSSFVGYKDNLLRLVTVFEQLTPCNPPGLTSGSTSTSYTVFISDPTPLKEIVADMDSR